ncbi:MAG: hypothetical protein HY328_14860 [Chloroflexi bacterium]|nr:hypothetical protein [Chloroflexota bacterium]
MFRNVKRKWMYLVVMSVIASLLFASIAVAQDAPNTADDLPGSGWWTGIQLQNVGAAKANVSINSYQSTAGSAPIGKSVEIAKDASVTLLPQDLNLSSGFQGSAVVSSDQPLNAIVNVTNRQAAGNGIAGGMAAAQYQGVNAPATELRFPLVKRDHFGKTTTFSIQNAGSTAATAIATFRVQAGQFTFTTPSIEPGRMVIINPAAAGVPSGNNVSVGSLTVTSSQPLAGVVSEHGSEQPAVLLQSTRAFAPQDGNAKAYAPIIKNEYFNRFTGLQVQNISAATITIDVTYNGSGGTCAGQIFTNQAANVAAGASATFVHLVGQAGNTMPAGCLASATINATGGNIVAIVNEAFTSAFLAGGGNGGRQEATTYAAFPASAATTTVKAPLFKEKSYDKLTGLQVQNVGSVDATNVIATFVGPGGTYTTNPLTIKAGSGLTIIEMYKHPELFNGTPIPADIKDAAGVFGVTITSDQSIVAIANESTYPFGASPLQQDKNNYEAFN